MRPVCIAVGIFAMFGVETPGRAQPEPFARVAVLAAGEDARDLEAALSERLARLGLRVRVALPSLQGTDGQGRGDGSERARIWIDMQSGSDVVIRVAAVRAGTLQRPAERRIPRSESDAITVEQISEVAYDTLDSLLASDDAHDSSAVSLSPSNAGLPSSSSAVPPSPPSPVEELPVGSVPPPSAGSSPSQTAAGRPPPGIRPSPARPARGLSDIALGAQAFASARGFSNEAAVIAGGGAAGEITMARLPARPSVTLSAAVNAPFDAHVGAFTLETSVSCLRLLPGIEIFGRGWMQIDAGVGGGVDLLRTVPRTLRSSPYPFDVSRTAVDPMLTGQVLLRTPVPSGAALTFAADVDYDAAPHSYRSPASPGSPSRVFQPWAVQPALMVGLCIPLAGRHPCASGP